MEKSIEKLQKLHKSVRKLESVLQEVWSLMDEFEDDHQCKDLLNNAKKYQTKKQKSDHRMEDLIVRLDEFDHAWVKFQKMGRRQLILKMPLQNLLNG